MLFIIIIRFLIIERSLQPKYKHYALLQEYTRNYKICMCVCVCICVDLNLKEYRIIIIRSPI